MKTLMEQEIQSQSIVLKDCLAQNAENISNIADMLKRGKFDNIIMAARGSSDNACEYFKYAEEIKLGYPVSFAAPSVCTLYGGSIKAQNSLVFGVSQSGKAEDVLAIMRNAKSQGATVVAVTNNTESPMAKNCDIHLFLNVGEEKSVAATKTFLAQMYVLALIVAKASDEKLYSELVEMPSKLEEIFKLDYSEIANKLKDENQAIVLARGLNLAIAFETSLKIQETCYFNARCYPISDFHHGPFAIVDKNTNCIVFATKFTEKDSKEIIEKLKTTGCEPIVISHEDDILSMAKYKIKQPVCCSEFLSPFFNVVTAQCLALNLSHARGLNPDSPRGLKKVTITK